MIKITCKNPIYVNGIIAPCGKCFSCRRKYRRQWQLRLQHELLSYEGCAMFLTLTYNKDNLPLNNTLVKKDVQDFLKRLRKYYKDIKIRYFAVGEYGDEKFRPHYHLIIYGLRAPEQKKKSSLNFKYSLFLAEKIWKKGYCYVGYVNSQCIAYVSKYILKSFVKDISSDQLEKAGMLPPFSLKSTGIGLSWLLDNIDKVVHDLKRNKTVKLFKSRTSYPRYYRKKLTEFGYFDENYFASRYYKEMDTLQDSIIQELSEAHIKLSSSNYLDISISQLFNLEKQTDLITEYHNLSLPRRYKSDLKKFPITFEVPYSVEKINDILENHWFIVYKNYISSCHDSDLKYFINTNKNWFSEYE